MIVRLLIGYMLRRDNRGVKDSNRSQTQRFLSDIANLPAEHGPGGWPDPIPDKDLPGYDSL